MITARPSAFAITCTHVPSPVLALFVDVTSVCAAAESRRSGSPRARAAAAARGAAGEQRQARVGGAVGIADLRDHSVVRPRLRLHSIQCCNSSGTRCVCSYRCSVTCSCAASSVCNGRLSGLHQCATVGCQGYISVRRSVVRVTSVYDGRLSGLATRRMHAATCRRLRRR